MREISLLDRFILPEDTERALRGGEGVRFAETLDELTELSCGGAGAQKHDVSYFVPGRGEVKEAEIHRCKNGVSVNFTEDYMRRRDADSMRIGDALPTDKTRFYESFGYDFALLRAETMSWLRGREVILLPFYAGGERARVPSALICPTNAAFFALSVALMQGFVSARELPEGFAPRGVFYVAPPFRHTHFAGRQIVVHCRSERRHEVFAYNLYPGPSAKKGVFSLLLDMGEREGRICCHASGVIAISHSGAQTTFMHEGASGGGKSEMLERARTQEDGTLILARKSAIGGEIKLTLCEQSALCPIADDMALAEEECDGQGRLRISDAERGWFLRTDGERGYGSSPKLERLSIHPEAPLEFFNMDCVAGATCLIWEHTKNLDGTVCSNPRVIMPRAALGSAEAGAAQGVQVRSFGVRMPPSTAARADVGVMGLVQVVPPALAWLWRLVSPRGYNNPSVVADGAPDEMKSEGVGAYWAFATGERVTQANMLLRQLMGTPGTLNLLIPNQYIGAYEVGFAGQWLAREYFARRGGRVDKKALVAARCPLFGWSLREMKIDSQSVPQLLLRPEEQRELGKAGYDEGAARLTEFFKKELGVYDGAPLDPLGREIIALCLADAPVEEYARLGGEK